MKQWYYTKVGIQQGPVPEDELLRKIRRGEIGESNLLWREGMGDWLPFGQIPELRGGPGENGPTGEFSTTPSTATPVASSAPPEEPRQMPQPEALSAQNIGREIPSYLAHSLVALVISFLMTVLICLPLGLPFAIVSLVYATKVDGLKAQGDILGAEISSKNAKLWMLISFGALALSVVGILVMVGILFLSS